MTTQESSPTSAPERIVALDVLRGFALLGVFLVNAFYGARPVLEAFAPPAAGEPSAEIWGWALIRVLAETKFVSIFSFLFGMGLILQMNRAEAKGQAFASIYVRRLAILGLMGLVHGILLSPWDILLPYAVIGLILFAARNLSPKRMISTAGVLLSVGLLLNMIWGYAGLIDGAAASPEDTASAYRAVTEGPLSLTLSYRAREYGEWLLLSTMMSFNWRVAALFFLGAAALKQGFLFNRTLPRKILVWGFPTGLALQMVGTGLAFYLPGSAGPVGALQYAASELGSILLAGSFVAGILSLVHSGRLVPLQKGLAAVGRTALTNYLGQSVLLSILFTWFGLNLFGKLSRLEVSGIVLALYLLQVGLSVLWLRVFVIGPMEWVWRSLTYGRVMGWKRSPTEYGAGGET